MEKVIAEVIKNELISNDIYEMTIKTSIKAKPGQFINISVNDKSLLLRRPISIKDVSGTRLKISYRVVGAGTKILSEMKKNDKIDLLGPLGNGFKIVKKRKVLIIGGGIGVPPMIYLAKKLHKFNDITIIAGFKNKSQIIYEEELKQYGKLFITTDDGSYGFKGNVIQFLNQNNIDFDIFYACGPTILLKCLDEKYFNVKEGYISFEERMACGIGACYGCVCKPKTLKDGMLRVCKEGPVFELGVIDYGFKG